MPTYKDLIQKAAEQYGQDPNLLAALLQQESNFNPRAQSKAGAQGLAQFMPGTAQQMNVTDPFNPQQAIPGAAQYLQWIQQSYPQFSPEQVLQSYNAGPGRVAQGGQLPMETQQYPGAVMGRMPNALEAAAAYNVNQGPELPTRGRLGSLGPMPATTAHPYGHNWTGPLNTPLQPMSSVMPPQNFGPPIGGKEATAPNFQFNPAQASPTGAPPGALAPLQNMMAGMQGAQAPGTPMFNFPPPDNTAPPQPVFQGQPMGGAWQGTTQQDMRQLEVDEGPIGPYKRISKFFKGYDPRSVARAAAIFAASFTNPQVAVQAALQTSQQERAAKSAENVARIREEGDRTTVRQNRYKGVSDELRKLGLYGSDWEGKPLGDPILASTDEQAASDYDRASAAIAGYQGKQNELNREYKTLIMQSMRLANNPQYKQVAKALDAIGKEIQFYQRAGNGLFSMKDWDDQINMLRQAQELFQQAQEQIANGADPDDTINKAMTMIEQHTGANLGAQAPRTPEETDTQNIDKFLNQGGQTFEIR